ncbi:hypothetical protein K440DRAFT_643360 [Wilcoxina mikolae CBS 423.85]|nr:hypothetical protein K440DRAFT_643360 [Wilcoxina mikolae CBS 423.85]
MSSATSNNCAICLDTLSEQDHVRLFPCNHAQFHEECIRIWFEVRNVNPHCPLCRGETVMYQLADGTVWGRVGEEEVCGCGVVHDICERCEERHHEGECGWESGEEDEESEKEDEDDDEEEQEEEQEAADLELYTSEPEETVPEWFSERLETARAVTVGQRATRVVGQMHVPYVLEIEYEEEYVGEDEVPGKM